MAGLSILINPLWPTTGTRLTLRLGYGFNSRALRRGGIFHYNAIHRAPRITMDFLDDALTGQLQTGKASFVINLKRITTDQPFLRSLIWVGSPVTITSGDGTDTAGWFNDFLGTITGAAYDRDSGLLTCTCEVDRRLVDVPLLNLEFGGLGGADGDPEMRGQLKPACFGNPVNVPVKFFDQVNVVGMVDGYGNVTAIDTLFEDAASFGPKIGDYASYAALIAADIPEGQWGTCVAQGMVRLGADPRGVITCDPVAGGATPGAMALRWLQTHAGVTAGRINSQSFTDLDTTLAALLGHSAAVSYFTDSQVQVLDRLQALMASCNSVPLLGPDGKITVTRAITAAEPLLTLNRRGGSPLVTGWRTVEGPEPWWRLKMAAARTWRVHQMSEIDYEDDLVDLGGYTAGTTYRQGNIVRWTDGARYLFIAAEPSNAVAPPTATHWELYEDPIDATMIFYVDGTPVEALQPEEAGANVTEINVAAAIAGQGALATQSTADFGTQVTGPERPADGATTDIVLAGVNGGVVGPGNTVTSAGPTNGGNDYSGAAGPATRGPSFAEIDINQTANAYTVIAFDDFKGTSSYGTYPLMAQVQKLASGLVTVEVYNGATSIYSEANRPNATKLMIAYDGANVRTFLDGVQVHSAVRRTLANNATKLTGTYYPKFLPYFATHRGTGLRAGPWSQIADLSTNIIDSASGVDTPVSRTEIRTPLGTAAAIAGQGALATMGSAPWSTHVTGRPTNIAALTGGESILNREALATTADNIIRNADLRVGTPPENWVLYTNNAGGATVPVRTQGTAAGDPAYYWKAPVHAGIVVAYPQADLADSMPAEAGVYYTLEARIRTGGVTAYMQFFDGAGVEVGAAGNGGGLAPGAGGTWRRSNFGRLAPPGTARVYLQFWFSSGAEIGNIRLYPTRVETSRAVLDGAGLVNKNPDISMVATDGRPLGWYRNTAGAVTPAEVRFNDEARTELTVDGAYGLTNAAFQIEPGTTYSINIRIKAAAAGLANFQAIMCELDSQLPTGATNVHYWADTEPGITYAPATRAIVLYSGALSDAAFVDLSYTYTPTGTAKWASLNFSQLNGVTYILKRAAIRNNATPGADVHTNVFDTSSGSRVSRTRAEILTALGTAAAITGQAPAATDNTIQAGATRNLAEQSLNRNGSFDDWVAGAPVGWQAAYSRTFPPTQETANSTRGVYTAKFINNDAAYGDFIPMGPLETFWVEYRFKVLTDATAGQVVIYLGVDEVGADRITPVAGNYVFAGAALAVSSGVIAGKAKLTRSSMASTAIGIRPLFHVTSTGGGVVLDYLSITRNEPASTLGADINSVNLFDTGSGTPTTALTRTEVRTALGTAAAFSGQGALATRASVHFGSSFLLEGLAGAQATLANFRTADGTAAGIAGQGSLATKSLVRLGADVYRAGVGAVIADADAITSLGVAASIAGQAATATNADFSAVTGVTKPEANATVDATIVIESPIIIFADVAGAPKPNEITKQVSAKLRRNGVDVTSGVTWTVTRRSGTATHTISGTGTATFSITGPNDASLSLESTFDLTANDGTISRTVRVKVERQDDPPTSAGGSAGTTASTTTLTNAGFTTYGNGCVSAILTAQPGPNGQVACTAPIGFKRTPGTATGFTGAYGKWKCRAVGGVFADIQAETAHSTAAETFDDPEAGAPTLNYAGSVNVNATKTGLTQGVNYEFQFEWRRVDVSGDVDNIYRTGGTMQAAGS